MKTMKEKPQNKLFFIGVKLLPKAQVKMNYTKTGFIPVRTVDTGQVIYVSIDELFENEKYKEGESW